MSDPENKRIEHKRCLRPMGERSTKLEFNILKEVVAFCNTDGGDLLIGVDDDGTIIGIEDDGFRNHDEFVRTLGALIRRQIVPFLSDCIEHETIRLDNKPVCWVRCKKGSEPVWLKPSKSEPEQFFVRFGSASEPLSPIETMNHIKRYFKDWAAGRE